MRSAWAPGWRAKEQALPGPLPGPAATRCNSLRLAGASAGFTLRGLGIVVRRAVAMWPRGGRPAVVRPGRLPSWRRSSVRTGPTTKGSLHAKGGWRARIRAIARQPHFPRQRFGRRCFKTFSDPSAQAAAPGSPGSLASSRGVSWGGGTGRVRGWSPWAGLGTSSARGLNWRGAVAVMDQSWRGNLVPAHTGTHPKTKGERDPLSAPEHVARLATLHLRGCKWGSPTSGCPGR